MSNLSISIKFSFTLHPLADQSTKEPRHSIVCSHTQGNLLNWGQNALVPPECNVLHSAPNVPCHVEMRVNSLMFIEVSVAMLYQQRAQLNWMLFYIYTSGSLFNLASLL